VLVLPRAHVVIQKLDTDVYSRPDLIGLFLGISWVGKLLVVSLSCCHLLSGADE